MSNRRDLDVAQGRRAFGAFFTDATQAPDGGIAPQLGFLGDSSPASWWNGKFASRDIDLAIHIGFNTAEQRTDCLAEVRRSAADFGVRELTLEGRDDRAAYRILVRRTAGCILATATGLPTPTSTGWTRRQPAKRIIAKSSSAIPMKTTPPRRMLLAYGRILRAMAPLSAFRGSIRTSPVSTSFSETTHRKQPSTWRPRSPKNGSRRS